jgi:hypothetical protein
MKSSILMGLAMAVVLVVSAGYAKQRPGNRVSKVANNVWVIPYTNVAPKLDGMVDSVWNAIDSQPFEYFNCSAQSVTDWSDLSGWCKLLWDGSNIYGLFYTMDDIIDTISIIDWQMDGVDIYVDAGNTHVTEALLGADQHQFCLRLAQNVDSVEKAYGHGLKYNWFLDKASINNGGPTGYYVQFQFPLDSLGITAQAGTKLSLELQQDDNDETAMGRIHISKWANSSGVDDDWYQTLHWGDAVLGDATTGAAVDNNYSYVFLRTPTAPVIDANTEANGGPTDAVWDQANQATMNFPGLGASYPVNPQEQSWRFYGLYDDNNIYGFFVVYDDVVDSTSRIDWQMDGVEFYTDAGNTHLTEALLGANQYQFCLRPAQNVDSVEKAYGHGLKYAWKDLPNVPNNSVFSSCSGYAVEFSFPLDSLGIVAQEGTEFSFELATDDNDGSGWVHHTDWWNSSGSFDDWYQTLHWGNAILGPAIGSITVTIPAAPILASPANGSTGVPTNPALTWIASSRATSYRLQLSADPTFATTTYDVSGLTTTSRSISGLSYFTEYYWRASATNVAGTSSWSSVWSFTTSSISVPALISVMDVPFDQGGKVELVWQASSLDTNVDTMPYYSIWRALPHSTQQNIVLRNSSSRFDGPSTFNKTRMMKTTAGTFAWEWLANQPAHKDSMYSYTASTLNDSMSGNNGMEYFLVSAQTSDPNVFYDSNVDSGYSVDNLPPLPPQKLVASVLSGKVDLYWSPNTESDLRDYLVYRSQSAITDSNKIAPYDTASYTSYVDARPLVGKAAYYVIRAEDIHGNLSAVSNQVSVIVTGVESQRSGIPTKYGLDQNFPNPFNPTTVINYQLPVNSHVTLKIYDALGREVASLVNDDQSAGYKSVTFDASTLPSGVYLYRITAGSFVETKKLVLIK